MPQSTPKLIAPPGAVDTHMHIYAPAGTYALAPTAVGELPRGDVDDYRQKQAQLGLSRTVIVQPTHYGADNSCTTAAMQALGADVARGVAVIEPDINDAELERLTEAGVRGVRFQMVPGGMTPWEDTNRLADRAAEFGWHAQLQLDGRELPDRLDRIKAWPGGVVIDHVGRFFEPVPVDHPAFKALLDLVAGGTCWVKLSAPYIHSHAGPPHFDDVGDLAKALIAAAPERMLWASNWPHPTEQDDPPDDGMLLDVMLDWATDEALRRRILVDNPAALYGF